MWAWLKKRVEETELTVGAFEYQADVEKKSVDMSWEELQEGFELLRLVSEFEAGYGEIPELRKFGPFYLGWRKVKRWRANFDIFQEGVKSGTKWAKEWIENSGWLKEDIQKKIEREEKEETGS